MWKTTGDEVWRERGWTIFKAIEQHCRLHVGYASVASVDEPDPGINRNKLDDMPRFVNYQSAWCFLHFAQHYILATL